MVCYFSFVVSYSFLSCVSLALIFPIPFLPPSAPIYRVPLAGCLWWWGGFFGGWGPFGIYYWLDGTHFSRKMWLSWNLHSLPINSRHVISPKALSLPNSHVLDIADFWSDVVYNPLLSFGFLIYWNWWVGPLHHARTVLFIWYWLISSNLQIWWFLQKNEFHQILQIARKWQNQEGARAPLA